MKAIIRRWGDSAAVRIPGHVLAAAELAIGRPVEIRQAPGRIIIQATHSKEYVLEDLLEKITPENLPHTEDLILERQQDWPDALKP